MTCERHDPTISELIGLGERTDAIRAILLTSSRGRTGAQPDAFSDYDVELYVTDAAPFAASDARYRDLGGVLATYREQETLEEGLRHSSLVQYEDGSRIDFTLVPVGRLDTLSRTGSLDETLELGFQVLLDKDGRTASLPKPGLRIFVPPVPTAGDATTGAHHR
jgi:aminoglycoside 6-adenylyltransferase